jgi:hypothetical protein
MPCREADRRDGGGLRDGGDRASSKRLAHSDERALEVRKREARVGRNPATGEAIKIMASKKVTFRSAKELKEAV